jgi:hypothetical protein
MPGAGPGFPLSRMAVRGKFSSGKTAEIGAPQSSWPAWPTAVRFSRCDNPGSRIIGSCSTLRTLCPDLIRASTSWKPRSPRPRRRGWPGQARPQRPEDLPISSRTTEFAEPDSRRRGVGIHAFGGPRRRGYAGQARARRLLIAQKGTATRISCRLNFPGQSCAFAGMTVKHLILRASFRIGLLVRDRRCRPAGDETATRARFPGASRDPPIRLSNAGRVGPGFPPGKRFNISFPWYHLVSF